MSSLDMFFEKDGSLKNYTPLNKIEKQLSFKEVENRFKISYHKSKMSGIVSLSPMFSDEAPFDCDSYIFVSVSENIIRVRCRAFKYLDEYKTKTWDRDQSKFEKEKRNRRITFRVPVELVGRYYKVEPLPAGFDLIMEEIQ